MFSGQCASTIDFGANKAKLLEVSEVPPGWPEWF